MIYTVATAAPAPAPRASYRVRRFLSDGMLHTERSYVRASSAAQRFATLAYEMLGDSADRDTNEGHRVMHAAECQAEAVTRGGFVSGTVTSRGRRIVIERVPASEPAAPTMVAQPCQQQQAFPLRAGTDRTIRDLTLSHHSPAFILPAGTAVVGVRDGLGQLSWAVASERLVAELSGNAHDARHRYCFVPADAVQRDAQDGSR